MPTYKLTLTKRDDPSPVGASENPVIADTVIYVHPVADEAAALKIVHDLTKPQRAKRGRPAATAAK